MVEAKTATKAPKTIVEIISAISKEAGALGLVKPGGSGVPFAFRGINDTVNHLAPFLDKYGVVVVPSVFEQELEMHATGTRFLTDAKVVVDYTFYSPDGSSLTARTLGYAQDFSDRAAAQAQSVSFRVALLQTFHLPTADKEPEVAGEDTQKILAQEAEKTQKAVQSAPSGSVVSAETLESVRGDIQSIIEGNYVNKATGELVEAYPGGGAAVNALGNALTKKAQTAWFASLTDLQKVRAALLEKK